MKHEIIRLAEAMAVAMVGEKDAVALIEARAALETEVESLTADRDSWKQAHDEQVEKLLEISANRDEYQREADSMAAAHKVERDALKEAAKKALDEMENVTYAVLSGAITVDVLNFERTVAALKAVL